MIENVEALRELYRAPASRVFDKELPELDAHCLRFVGLSPFVVLSSVGADGRLDASPRGGLPGFVRPSGPGCLLVPDASGNNRLDTLTNVVESGRVGMLFLVPGVDETLRVNGRAVVSRSESDLSVFVGEGQSPTVVIRVEVESAYLHCAKALMRSRLWDPAGFVDASSLPSIGEMINDQIGCSEAAESRFDMVARYERELRP